MKDLKLSFPYPSTSRHNLSQDVSTSLSMGLVTPVRVIEVLPGDSHRIGTSFSLISNPLVKPLLQSVRMRYMRFWVPSRIYHIDQRANNTDFDPMEAPVRYGRMESLFFPANFSGTSADDAGELHFYSNFQQSSLFDYLGLSGVDKHFASNVAPLANAGQDIGRPNINLFNAEPYIAYIDICRNYFGDSATGMIAWSNRVVSASSSSVFLDRRCVIVSPLAGADRYIDSVQNSTDQVAPYDFSTNSLSESDGGFPPFMLHQYDKTASPTPAPVARSGFFYTRVFGLSHVGFCVPMNRPDRLSRLFDTRPLTSQNATVSQNEITVANLSFLSKLQKYLTRRFFGGSRYTDVMYNIFGQKVPHVDSPVLLDVFDREIGSRLVSSTNAEVNQGPGVLGGFFCANGYLSSRGGRSRKRYSFNERGYLIDLVYIMPALFRTAFVPDYYPLDAADYDSNPKVMAQANFIPDFNGIGWQQPAFVNYVYGASRGTEGDLPLITSTPVAFCCEPSWQQYRTLPDVVHGTMNPILSNPVGSSSYAQVAGTVSGMNSPLFVFVDRPSGNTMYTDVLNRVVTSRSILAQHYYSDFNDFNRVFGASNLTFDNIFAVFSFTHQAKRQVTKRFTLSFN